MPRPAHQVFSPRCVTVLCVSIVHVLRCADDALLQTDTVQTGGPTAVRDIRAFKAAPKSRSTPLELDPHAFVLYDEEAVRL
jgi:hypothetical protein